MNKKPLIIKEYSRIVAKDGYLMLFKKKNRFVISYKYILAIFISNKVSINLYSLTLLSQKFPIFIIDGNGTIKSKITRIENERV
jgi:hypothetical protein